MQRSLVLAATILLVATPVGLKAGSLQQALRAMAEGDHSQAVSILQRLAGNQALILKGRAQFLAKRYQSAIRTYLLVLERAKPKSAAFEKASFGLAECYAATGQFMKAEKRFSDALSRLGSKERRQTIAKRYILLGDEHLDPQDGKRQADPIRAEQFYRAAVEVGIAGSLAQECQLKIARSLAGQKNFIKAAEHLFWFMEKNQKSARRPEAAYLAGKYSNQAKWAAVARRYLREVLTSFPKSAFAHRAAFLISRTYGMPRPTNGVDLARGIASLEDFIRSYPKHKRGQAARLELATAAQHLRRYAQAEDALRAYIKSKGAAGKTLASARYNLGACLAAQDKFQPAIRAWQEYLKKHPSHENWLQARSGIENTYFEQAQKAYQQKSWSEAAGLYARFAGDYPAAARSPQALYLAAEAYRELKKPDQALKTLRMLTGKFPKNKWARDGWALIGRLLEEKGDMQNVRKAYEQAKKAGHGVADSWLRELERPSLLVESPARFLTDQKPALTWHSRNLEAVTVRIFHIQAEDFFRDRLDMELVTGVDIALCTPDQTLSVKVKDYLKGRRAKQEVLLPIKKPGLYLVNLTSGDLEATTAVIVSDLGLILKTAPGEAFVFTQDLRRTRPLGGTRVLIADSEKILTQGVSDKNGVLRTDLKSNILGAELRAFAIRGDQMTWTRLDHAGSQPITAVSPRAFLFPDRPVYQPGDQVQVAGIIRDQVGPAGTLSFKPRQEYLLSFHDPRGRLMSKGHIKLDDFGVFHGGLGLDSTAQPGSYRFTLSKSKGPSFSGYFSVKPYRFRPFHVTIDLDHPVVFQGEKVEGSVRVRHHHGSAAANQPVRIRLLGADVTRIAKTDKNGQARFSFPTTGYEETQKVQLTAIVGKNVMEQRATVLIAVQGYRINLTVEQKTLFAGQPFDLTVEVKGPDNRPRPAAITLEALRLVDGSAETRVFTRELSIPKDGRLITAINLPGSGLHILRVFGYDRARHPITAEVAVTTTGQDQPGITFDLERSIQTLGTPARVQIHSRLDKSLVLLTYETDRILGYRTVVVKEGQNLLEIHLEPELVPNFVLAAASMHQDKFYQAARDIRVTRRMQLAVRADKKSYAPGEQVTLTVIARDADSRPVDARVILSVVDQALLRVFPENLPDLLATFHHLRPTGSIGTISSNTFRFPETTAHQVEQAEVLETEGSAAMAALSARRKVMTGKAVESFADLSGSAVGELHGIGGLGTVGHGAGGGGFGRGSGRGRRGLGGGAGATTLGIAPLRQYLQHTAAFLPEIRTGPDGVASVSFKLPDSITTWQVTSRGVTRDTQLGEHRTELVASKPFWVDLVVPPELEEGDRLQPVAQIFNETGKTLDVSLKLTAGKQTYTQSVRVDPRRPVQVPFPELAVPDLDRTDKLAMELQASASSLKDRLRREVPVRPRGIREQAMASGRLTRTATRTLVLEEGLTDPELVVSLDARMAYMFFVSRLDPMLFGDRPEEALVALNLLGLLGKQADPTMLDLLHARLRGALYHMMSFQQHDGGWGSSQGSLGLRLRVTAAAVRAIVGSRVHGSRLGWTFPQADLDRAVEFLTKGLSDLPAEDWMERAAVLYALSHLGKQKVPVAHLHRLHRLRGSLPLGAQAMLGLSWMQLKRPEKAAEVAKTMRPSLKSNMRAEYAFSWLMRWGEEPSDLAFALALLALVNPSDPLVDTGSDWMLEQGETFGWRFPRQAEAFSFALAKTLKGQAAGQRHQIRVALNGSPAGVVQLHTRPDSASARIQVDPGLIKPGKNVLKLVLEGSGSCFFSASLSAYRKLSPAPKKDALVRIQRHLEPVPEPFQGREIPAGFSVEMSGQPRWINRIDAIPAQRQVKVTLQIERDFAPPLDHCVLTDRIPPGFELVEGSASGDFRHLQKVGRSLAFFLASASEEMHIFYRLRAVNPGAYHFPPARIMSLANPLTQAIGGAAGFSILARNEKLPATGRPTPDELYHVGTAAAEKQPALAIERLERLNQKHRLKPHIAKEVLAKLLFASIDVSDHQRIVKYFELAKEKNPELVIPFDKIGPVQDAYRTLKVYEAGLHLARGLAEARFMAEVRGVGILEAQDQTAESLDFLKQVVNSYPDNALSAKATYAFSQVIYNRADQISEGTPVEGFDRPGLLEQVVELMASYLGRFPADPQGPAAVYSLASALLEQNRPERAVAWCGAGLQQFPESDLSPAITYLKAFSHFRLGQYDSSLKLCRQVATDSPDEESREMARYIMAQIHHARGQMTKALELYRKVRDRFRDASETVAESERVLLEAPDVIEVTRGRRAILKMTTRNIKNVDLRAYRVDPMKLYLIKGSLDDLREVNLAGIRPVFSRAQRVQDHVGVTRKQEIPVSLPGRGAYLLLARGKHKQTHSLVLVGNLNCEVTEDAGEGRVRVTVRKPGGQPVVGARVQLKGSNNYRFRVGHTDLRGIYIADEINGAVTAIASHQGAYGLYRGTVELTAVEKSEGTAIYPKKTVYDFDDSLIEGQLMRVPDPEAQNFFQQDVQGMSVEQAK